MEGTWLGLATVLAASIPASIAAFYSYRSARIAAENRKQLVTGNEKTVGEMVTEVHGKESERATDFQTHR